MGMPVPVYFTAEMVRALPDDGNRYETVHGELLVSAAPRPLHQLVWYRLIRDLGAYLERYPTAGVMFGGGDISWSDDTLVIPDIIVVERGEALSMTWAQMKTLHLVVEVLSPSTARNDRFTKRRLYQEVGIPLYWLVDADAKVVEVWTPEARFPAVESGAITWRPPGAGEALEIRLEELFAPLGADGGRGDR